jgi:sterol desaturase/sphingolipid hydroxylase (fatty acid hydroxylase superfamily)
MKSPVSVIFDAVISSLWAPVAALGKPDSRVYLPYLFGAALFATVVWAIALRRRTSLVSFLFPRSVWLHPSALLDYRLLFARSIIRAVLFGPLLFSSLAVAMAVSAGLGSALGARTRTTLEPATVMLFFTLTAFLAEDFARYCVHRLAHTIPALWELHKLHHSAEVMTPFTVYRAHPLESLLMRSGAVLAVGLVAGVFHWLFPGRVSGAMILGVDAMGFVWNVLGSNLRHSHVWVSYGRVLEHIFISPAQHQIHHSDQLHHTHKNLGSTLAIWDAIGGSLYVTSGREHLQFGLPPSDKNHENTVGSALVDPLRAALRGLVAGWRFRGPRNWVRAPETGSPKVTPRAPLLS